jgi:hypothetical protein
MKALSALLAVMVACVLVAGLHGEGEKGKAVTKEGKMVCGKCTLMETAKCCNVLQVKEGGKTVNYFLKDKGNKEAYHKGICPAGKSVQATVRGTVTEQDGKHYISNATVKVKGAD